MPVPLSDSGQVPSPLWASASSARWRQCPLQRVGPRAGWVISTLTYEVSSHSTGENTEPLMVIETRNRGRIDEPRILWLLTGFTTVGFAEVLAFLWTIKFRSLTHLGLAETKHSGLPQLGSEGSTPRKPGVGEWVAVSGFKTLHLRITVWGSGPPCFSRQTQSSQEPRTKATEDIAAVAGIAVRMPLPVIRR